MAAIAIVATFFLIAHLDTKRQDGHLARQQRDTLNMSSAEACPPSETSEPFIDMTKFRAPSEYSILHDENTTGLNAPPKSSPLFGAKLGALRGSVKGTWRWKHSALAF